MHLLISNIRPSTVSDGQSAAERVPLKPGRSGAFWRCLLANTRFTESAAKRLPQTAFSGCANAATAEADPLTKNAQAAFSPGGLRGESGFTPGAAGSDAPAEAAGEFLPVDTFAAQRFRNGLQTDPSKTAWIPSPFLPAPLSVGVPVTAAAAEGRLQPNAEAGPIKQQMQGGSPQQTAASASAAAGRNQTGENGTRTPVPGTLAKGDSQPHALPNPLSPVIPGRVQSERTTSDSRAIAASKTGALPDADGVSSGVAGASKTKLDGRGIGDAGADPGAVFFIRSDRTNTGSSVWHFGRAFAEAIPAGVDASVEGDPEGAPARRGGETVLRAGSAGMTADHQGRLNAGFRFSHVEKSVAKPGPAVAVPVARGDSEGVPVRRGVLPGRGVEAAALVFQKASDPGARAFVQSAEGSAADVESAGAAAGRGGETVLRAGSAGMTADHRGRLNAGFRFSHVEKSVEKPGPAAAVPAAQGDWEGVAMRRGVLPGRGVEAGALVFQKASAPNAGASIGATGGSAADVESAGAAAGRGGETVLRAGSAGMTADRQGRRTAGSEFLHVEKSVAKPRPAAAVPANQGDSEGVPVRRSLLFGRAIESGSMVFQKSSGDETAIRPGSDTIVHVHADRTDSGRMPIPTRPVAAGDAAVPPAHRGVLLGGGVVEAGVMDFQKRRDDAAGAHLRNPDASSSDSASDAMAAGRGRETDLRPGSADPAARRNSGETSAHRGVWFSRGTGVDSAANQKGPAAGGTDGRLIPAGNIGQPPAPTFQGAGTARLRPAEALRPDLDAKAVRHNGDGGTAGAGPAPGASAPGLGNDALPHAVKVPPPINVSEQLAQNIGRALQRGDGILRLNLKPPELGAVRVKIDRRGKTLRIELMTAKHETRELLTAHLQDLRDALSDHGVKADKIDIQMNFDFDRSMADAESRHPQQGRNTSQASPESRTLEPEDPETAPPPPSHSGDGCAVDLMA